jgi:orotidine 5'-phosphate decarboxylase subfamily 2
MDFLKKLKKGWKGGKFVCIGLDPVVDKLPKHLKGDFFKFNKAIIDETADLVLAYKPNSAFYEAEGSVGIGWLKKTCDYINKKYPNIPVILDAKRADIGSTNEGYVKFAFDYLNVSAITVHPYLGKEALDPFLERRDRGRTVQDVLERDYHTRYEALTDARSVLPRVTETFNPSVKLREDIEDYYRTYGVTSLELPRAA